MHITFKNSNNMETLNTTLAQKTVTRVPFEGEMVEKKRHLVVSLEFTPTSVVFEDNDIVISAPVTSPAIPCMIRVSISGVWDVINPLFCS